MTRHLLRSSDLDADQLEELLDRSRRARSGELEVGTRFVATLVFLGPSTRTRLGFAVATARLGGSAFDVFQQRATGPGLPPESIEDTLRVCSGISDVVVFRSDGPVDAAAVARSACCPVINAGDANEHPTQAVIERFAVETFSGPVGGLHVGLSGDLTTRSTRSLLGVLAIEPPRRLSLFAPPGRAPIDGVPAALADRTDIRADPDFSELDVLVLPGLSPGTGAQVLDDEARQRWGLSPESARILPERAIVISPGPVIDEVHPLCRGDSRLRVFEEADLGVFVRIAVLSWLMWGR